MTDEPMSDEPAGSDASAADAEGLTPLIDDLRKLAADARTLAEAELAFQTSRAAVAAGSIKRIAIFGALAAALVLFALLALTVGLLLALTPLVTAWGATAIVTGGLVLAAALCAGAASGRVRRLKALLGAGSDKP